MDLTYDPYLAMQSMGGMPGFGGMGGGDPDMTRNRGEDGPTGHERHRRIPRGTRNDNADAVGSPR